MGKDFNFTLRPNDSCTRARPSFPASRIAKRMAINPVKVTDSEILSVSSSSFADSREIVAHIWFRVTRPASTLPVSFPLYPGLARILRSRHYAAATVENSSLQIRQFLSSWVYEEFFTDTVKSLKLRLLNFS